MTRLLTFALAIVLVAAIPALAQQPTHILRGNGEKAIAVWRGESSAEAGTRLLSAGQADLAAKHVACVVPPGTRIVVMPGGQAMHRVTIIDGKSRGCEGSVYAWDIAGDRRQREAEAARQKKESKAEMARLERRSKDDQECYAVGRRVYERTLDGQTMRVVEAMNAERAARVECMTARGYTDTADHKTIRIGRWSRDIDSGCGAPSGRTFDKYEECLAAKRSAPAEAEELTR